MRIIGGKLKGRLLVSPKTNTIRPTTDRARETLFNIILHNYNDNLNDARVFDCYSGTGALGLEALSRGAKFVLFNDYSYESRALLRENIQNCGVAAYSKMINRDVRHLGRCDPYEPFNLVFLDPPYAQNLVSLTLENLLIGNWLAAEAIIIIEENITENIVIQKRFKILDQRRVNDSQFIILQIE